MAREKRERDGKGERGSIEGKEPCPKRRRKT